MRTASLGAHAPRYPRLHPQRAAVDVEQGLLLLHVGGFLLADADELAQHLHVEAGRFGLGIDVLDVAAERLAFFFQPLDALDQAAQAVGGDPAGFCLGSCPPPAMP